jgi:hypothetical protein
MRGPVIVATILGVAVLQGNSVNNAAPAQESTGAAPLLYMSIQGLSSRGGSHGEASASWPLKVGETAQVRVRAGSPEVSSLCGIGSGSAESLKGASIGWLLEGDLLEADATGARVKLRWKRSPLQRAPAGVGDFAREYEVRLDEGVRMTLDLVRPDSGAADDCDGVVVQAWMDFSDPPALASQLLDFDIWLVHSEPDGREFVDRASGRTLHGQDLRYQFKTLRYDTHGVAREDGDVELKLGGRVKARIRPDGQIDLAVSAGRMVTHGSLGSGEHGTKQAAVRDGETVEIELPPHHSNRYTLPQRSAVRVTVRRVG